ncbi:anti-sigma factor antagonist [Thermotoga sp. KOL6]|uniref:anti-sigma factor antagonist n=1 Tax=Thermotoga sp. KOL6 TaxID=126741 RepID=UPI000C78BB8C|nr:anti-sigma factor antagonist [Thermotoga sp. KOL6]PLV59819.1 anti-anti-sigma factor [Thermotoga sp. KOL6]
MFPYRIENDVVILIPKGELSIENAHLFKKWVLDEFLNKGYNKILLVLSDVESMDSFSLGVIVNILKSINSTGGFFAVVSPSEKVERILEITGLNRIVKIYDTISEALEEVRKS